MGKHSESVHAPMTIRATKLDLFLMLFVWLFFFFLGVGHKEEGHGPGMTGK